MVNKLELIVPLNKKNIQLMIIIAPCMIAALFWWLSICIKFENIFNYYLISLAKLSIIGSILMFLIGFIFAIFLIQDNEPAAVLNEDGIRVKYFGLIAWENIDKMEPYKLIKSSVESIGIRVKNVSLYNQATLSGKSILLWSKIFGYPPIILSNLALENFEVINFANRFIKIN